MGEVVYFPADRVKRLIENPEISQRLTRRSVIAGIIQTQTGCADDDAMCATDALIDFVAHGQEPE